MCHVHFALIYYHSCPQRPCSFWSAPRVATRATSSPGVPCGHALEIGTPGQVQRHLGLNGFVNTIDWDQNQSDLSDLTLGIHRVTGNPWIVDFRCWTWPEVVIPVFWPKGLGPLGTRLPLGSSNFLSKCRVIVSYMYSQWIRFVRLDSEHSQEVCESWTSGVGPLQRLRFLVLTSWAASGDEIALLHARLLSIF